MGKRHHNGSWVCNEVGEIRHVWEEDGHTYKSAVIAKLRGSTMHNKANAALLAASPDLLEALKLVLNLHGEQLSSAALEQVNAAVEKATTVK